MSRYLAERLLQSVFVLALMSFLVYGLIGLMPGDPVDLMISADPRMTSEDAARLRLLYGLDKPFLERYGNWLRAALAGDFGHSRLHAQPVLAVLAPALANTLALMGLAFVVALVVALPLGVVAAAKRGSPLDTLINGMAFAGISLPPFWLALLLIIVFAVVLGWLPASAMVVDADAGIGTRLGFLVLPIASLAIANVGGYVRYVRAAMLDVLGHDFIRTARAKGVSEARILAGHALQGALIPVVTILGLEFGTLFSGALVTETVFAYPGMGKLIFDAIMGNDFNLALVALLLATAVTLAGNVLADIAYVALDPRVTLERLDR
jgi:peptide/nickel transport system permease protein